MCENPMSPLLYCHGPAADMVGHMAVATNNRLMKRAKQKQG